MKGYSIMACLVLSASVILATVGCPGANRPKIVVYSALDREFSEPVFAEFTEKTGIQVLAKYDPESSKTVQLTSALLMEGRNRTRCDLFWNNEILNTFRLEHAGLLASYRPKQADHFPAAYQSNGGLWHGFAARARVLLVNTEVVSDEAMPSSIYDLVDPRWQGKIGIAKPLFGTTATHFVCLFEALGQEQAEAFCQQLQANRVQVLSGNKQVAEDVAHGRIAFGLTDTDDALIELNQGFPVKLVYPDSAPGQLGTLFVPNTLALLQDAPHPRLARQLADFILSEQVERRLAAGPSAQIPLHSGVQIPLRVETPDTIQAMRVDFEAAARRWDVVGRYLRDHFLSE